MSCKFQGSQSPLPDEAEVAVRPPPYLCLCPDFLPSQPFAVKKQFQLKSVSKVNAVDGVGGYGDVEVDKQVQFP